MSSQGEELKFNIFAGEEGVTTTQEGKQNKREQRLRKGNQWATGCRWDPGESKGERRERAKAEQKIFSCTNALLPKSCTFPLHVSVKIWISLSVKHPLHFFRCLQKDQLPRVWAVKIILLISFGDITEYCIWLQLYSPQLCGHWLQ